MKNLTKIFALAALVILAANSNTTAYAQVVVAPGTQGVDWPAPGGGTMTVYPGGKQVFPEDPEFGIPTIYPGGISTSSDGAGFTAVEKGIVSCGCAAWDHPETSIITRNSDSGLQITKLKNSLVSGCPMVEMCIPDTYCVIKQDIEIYKDGKLVKDEIKFLSFNCSSGDFEGSM